MATRPAEGRSNADDALRRKIRSAPAAITKRELPALVSMVPSQQRRAIEQGIKSLVKGVVASVEEVAVREIQRTQMREQAAALQAEEPWEPYASDVQRGRMAMLAEFNKPANLPLPRFAALAGKSRQQIYKDIDDRKLLALGVGARGKRLPDWQLDALPRALTQAVLRDAGGIDEWTLYRALGESGEVFPDAAAIARVTATSVEKVAARVLRALGRH